MKKILKIEWYKLLHTRRFWVCLGAGIFFCALNFAYWADMYPQVVENRKAFTETYGPYANTDLMTDTLYNCWIGNEESSFGYSLFYSLYPLLCCIPYGWSMNRELQSGYWKNVAVRTKKGVYLGAKGICAFVSGGIVMALPLLLNFTAVAAVVPALYPDAAYPYFTMDQQSFLSDLYFEKPVLFNLIYIAISFLYGGGLASLSFAAGCLFRHKLLAVLFPYALFLVGDYFATQLLTDPLWLYDLSPLRCIHPTPVSRGVYGPCIFLYFGLMLLAAVVAICRIKRKGRDIF